MLNGLRLHVLALLHRSSEFVNSRGVTVHDFEDPSLRNFVFQGCLDDVTPSRDRLFGAHLRELAVERGPAI